MRDNFGDETPFFKRGSKMIDSRKEDIRRELKELYFPCGFKRITFETIEDILCVVDVCLRVCDKQHSVDLEPLILQRRKHKQELRVLRDKIKGLREKRFTSNHFDVILWGDVVKIINEFGELGVSD